MIEPRGQRRLQLTARRGASEVATIRATDGEARSLKSAHAQLHSVYGHDLDGLLAQVFNQIGEAEHPLRYRCLELRFAGEDD